MTSQRQIAVAVMATENGLSSRSKLSPLLHDLGGKPIVCHVLDNVLGLQPAKTFVVVAAKESEVVPILADRDNIQFVDMVEQRGTGHVMQQLMPLLKGFEGDLIVIDGILPLLHPGRVTSLHARHQYQKNSATIMTTLVQDINSDYIFYSLGDDMAHHGTTAAEQKNGDTDVGVFCFSWPDLVASLQAAKLDNDVDIYDLYKLLSFTKQVERHCIPASEDAFRITDHKQLAGAYKVLQKRRKDRWMTRGVTFLDPDSVTVDENVKFGESVIVEPQTHLRGKTTIGDGCCIGPGTLIENSEIGARCKVRFSVISDSKVANETWVGPYTHLRANTQLGEGCRVGNFVEIKNASFGNSTFAGHLSYLGDAELGNNVNVGAGTITANFDGFKKHKTTIHDGAKTGANSVLVAPITIGNRVTIGAGSTVTEDVDDKALVVARTRQVVKPDWKPKPK